MRSRSPDQTSGRNSRKLICNGDLTAASVSETSVWQLAFLPSVVAYCVATATSLTLLRQRRVIDHEDRVWPTNQSAGLRDERLLQRSCVPDPFGDEVVQLVVREPPDPRRHELDALALAQPNQAGHVERVYRAPNQARRGRQERLEPNGQVSASVIVHCHRDRSPRIILTRRASAPLLVPPNLPK
ncbi:hypothetical protein AFFFEF_03084 [Methylorubrum extorquens]